MGAHVFVVNSDTIQVTKNRLVCAVVRDMGKDREQVEKTRADVLADLSCLREGDKIFFYEISVGFHGIFEAVGKPFISEEEINYDNKYLFGSEKNSHYKDKIIHKKKRNGDIKVIYPLLTPNRILIKPLKVFKNPISEMKAFGRFISAVDLRSIFYKKVLGRGKSITHLFPEEEQKLTQLLSENNEIIQIKTNPYKPLDKKDVEFDLNPNSNNEVKFEKILEGYIIQNIEEILPKIDNIIDLEIECFANYVPVTIAGGNLDVVVFFKNKQGKRVQISIIELKKGIIVEKDIEQLEGYVKWATENLAQILKESNNKIEIDLINNMSIIKPIIIGSGINQRALNRLSRYNLMSKKPVAIEYKLNKNKIDFIILNPKSQHHFF